MSIGKQYKEIPKIRRIYSFNFTNPNKQLRSHVLLFVSFTLARLTYESVHSF